MSTSIISTDEPTLSKEGGAVQCVLPLSNSAPGYAVSGKFGFNPILQRLVDNPGEVPLAVERFRKFSNCSDPIQAIQKETAQLLGGAQALPTEFRPFVSVSALCKFLDISVQGALLRPQNKRSYSIYSPPFKGINRTGRLEVTEGGLIIKLPKITDLPRARLALAHEIGHLLLLNRDDGFDATAWEAHSTAEEEALAEYAARLLLLPSCCDFTPHEFGLAKSCVYTAGTRRVTIHTAVSRLKDIDNEQKESAKLNAAILWRIDPSSVSSSNTGALTPQWFICPNTFIPVGRCHARVRSLVAQLCDQENGEHPMEGEREEAVSIGGLRGTYHVSAFAWGSMRQGTRLVLSLFSSV